MNEELLAVILDALAYAIDCREDRATGWCADCKDEPCADHVTDLVKADEWRQAKYELTRQAVTA